MIKGSKNKEWKSNRPSLRGRVQIDAEAISDLRLLRSFGARNDGQRSAAFIAIAVLAIGFSLFASASCAYAEESISSVLGRIPVQHGGRAKPFASFARENVLLVTGKTSFEGQDPTLLVWRWVSDPKVWSAKPMIPVTHPELRKKFSEDLVHNRISPDLVLNNVDFIKKVSAAQEEEEKEKSLPPFEKKQIELYERARLFSEIASGRMPGFVPHPEDPKVAWLPLEALITKEGLEVVGQFFPELEVDQVRSAALHLMERLKGSNFAEALPAAEQFTASLSNLLLSRDIQLDQAAVKLELFYLKLRPFHLALILYLISIFVWAAPRKKEKAIVAAFLLFLTGFLIHTTGIVLRVLIAGRPPVTNMYESIIWVGWAVALFSLVLWFFYRSSLLPMIAACVGTLALLVGESFPTLLDPSISPLVPVLRSNYWLTIHVLTITLGYGAFALNWGIAHALLYCMAFHKKKELIEHLTEYLYRSLQIGVILLSTGTILGGVWASYSWGRFWGWDPKETWALIAVLAYLSVLHSRTAGWLNSFGTAFWSAACFLTVLMAWYGVNFVLGMGLHSYGFGGGGLPYVLAFVFLDVILLLFFAKRFKIGFQHE